ncbi:hypothetical protein ZHAS_00009990 [Anopheles sinensis]|uniref:Uncharacterized protein n=1 Tax=Anopheles sinensis TaxID=74873 RepID=A0A084VWG1_ANOSI|nr:hypothetical protein ZHAS_00009990 [Anopheles sinensis]
MEFAVGVPLTSTTSIKTLYVGIAGTGSLAGPCPIPGADSGVLVQFTTNYGTAVPGARVDSGYHSEGIKREIRGIERDLN